MIAAAVAPIRIVIADDQGLFRAGLARLMADDARVEVVGQAVDGADAVAKCKALKPQVVLMDLKMPGLEGPEATQRILEDSPDTKVLILTTFEADSYVMSALKAGASGYVLKDSTPEAIISSVLSVSLGERVMASAVATRVVDMLTGQTSRREYLDDLTARETEILKLIASGKANKQIAFALRISEKTVRNHISNMYEKLQIFDRSQAVLYAVRKGLVEL
jgi:DNA-binding NarL/FixJ family response regulator